MLSVKSNLLAMNADRQLGINTKKNTKITEKLSSGYKINRAADDAAGLAISEKMRRQIRGLSQGADNIKDGIGYVQTAEGALNEVHEMLQRINELAVKAANGTYTVEDRAAINSEIQQLKVEMNRIFSTTTFNERKIWDYGPGEQLEYRTEPAVFFTGDSSEVIPDTDGNITNANCGVIALSDSGYTLHADTKGIMIDWTGYDGNKYMTETISWDEVKVNGNVYSFEMSNYFGEKNKDNKLYTFDDQGNASPVFTKEVSFSVNPLSTRKDIISSIDGGKMSSGPNVYMRVDENDSRNLSGKTSPIYISSENLTYAAAYASHEICEEKGISGGYDFNSSNDAFLVPSSMSGNLDAPVKDSDKYIFHFIMPGIGPVTATPNTSIFSSNYSSGDREMDKKDYWWQYRGGTELDGSWNPEKYKDARLQPMNGTLGSFKNAVTPPFSLLSEGKGGNTHNGGSIRILFNLTADDSFTYGHGKFSSSSVGSFSIYASVSPNTTYSQFMSDVAKALQASTVLDFSTINNDRASIGKLSNKATDIRIPIYPPDYEPYDDTQRFFVQAGAEAGQHIDIEYEFLNLEKLGMADTNTLTEEAAGNAINEVKAAMAIVSKQRSDFGAYQNRLEHAYNINNNTVENTQSAESLIRDTDIADAMMEYSVNNILLQAGVSMLTQANQLPSSVLELLNA